LSRIPRTTGQVAAAVSVVALVAVAADLGARLPGVRLLGGLPSHDPIGGVTFAGSLAPVSETYTREALGDDAFLAIVGGTADVAPPPEVSKAATPSPPAREPAPSIQGEPGVVESVAPGDWELTLAMTAARSTVEAGGTIDYVMTISNVGTGEFRGRSFVLQWHTPAGTFGRSAVVPKPGLGDALHEEFNSAGLVRIAPGDHWDREWHVDVPPGAPAGTEITNHAHLHVTVAGADREVTTETVTVTVDG
jgi:hypothetical protein